ncbi:sulfatase [Candidatus Poribacteria bacterium]|nr:sulfatase [Candidatus Poribacteria bacterium]MYA55209.1 sulfatase [Candidatus Poribacteria bacterium]
MNNSHKSVMFVIADDWSRIAKCYGNEVIRTPHIDAFAERGVVFDYAFCTSPSCAVSRACILTGQHSHTHGQYGHCHGIHGFRTHAYMQSVPKILKAHGFSTACLGKKHVEPESVYPFDFEPKVDPRSPVDMAAKVTEFLNEAADTPFYLHIGSSYPHRAGKGFGNDRTHSGIEPSPYTPDEIIVPNFLPDVPAVREDLADYYESVSRWDAVVGAVLEALDASGRADETLVFVTTDHAMPFPGAKASSFDSGHHCPLLIASPTQQKRGFHNQALINWVDFCPTMLEWCGVAHPDGADALPGKSLLTVLEDDSPHPGNGDWEETYFSHCFHEVTNYYPYRVLRGRRYKYVRNLAYQLETPLPSDLFRSISWTAVRNDNVQQLGERQRTEFLQQHREALFDMQNDPAESRNLIDVSALQDIANEMRQKVIEFRQKTEDPWLEQSFQEGETGPFFT